MRPTQGAYLTLIAFYTLKNQLGILLTPDVYLNSERWQHKVGMSYGKFPRCCSTAHPPGRRQMALGPLDKTRAGA